MDFGLEKCPILIVRSGKQHMTEGIELPNQDKIRISVKNKTDKYLRIMETDTIKQVEMKEKLQKRILQKNEKTTRNQTVQQKSHQRNT